MLLEIVAERGYSGVTMRELARRSGVSTRSVYQHYPNKEACFLGVHQIAVQGILRRIEAEVALDAAEIGRCLRCVVTAMVREWSSDPRAARLMLIDAYAAGPSALKQARLASRAIEARMSDEIGAVRAGDSGRPTGEFDDAQMEPGRCVASRRADREFLRGSCGRLHGSPGPR